MNLEECLNLAFDISEGKISREGEKIKDKVINSIILQSAQFQNITDSPQLRLSYQKVGEIFQELSKE